MSGKKFRFDMQTYRQSTILNDSRVVQYHIIAQGTTAITITNAGGAGMTIRAGSSVPEFKEDLNYNEQSGSPQPYRLQFANDTDPNNSVLVIAKTPVNL